MHGPAQAANLFGLAGGRDRRRARNRRRRLECGDGGRGVHRRRAGRLHDVVHGDEPAASAALDGGEVHAQPLGERPNGGGGTNAIAGRRDVAAGHRVLDQFFVTRRHLADDGAGVRRFLLRRRRPRARSQLELDERRAGCDDFARLAVQGLDAAGVRGGHLDDGLGRFQRHHRLVDLDRVADVDVPANDFRFRQAFTEIRKIERSHASASDPKLVMGVSLPR